MPIFEYQCQDCQFKFENLVKNSDQKVICPHCKKANVKKLVSHFSSARPACQNCSGSCSNCSK